MHALLQDAIRLNTYLLNMQAFDNIICTKDSTLIIITHITMYIYW